MTFYADSGGCICTIIEMKGRTQQGFEHGIEQIKSFRNKLRVEIESHLPNKFKNRIKFQGILLSPVNSDIPRRKIEREDANGFTILPIPFDHKAELFAYVSKLNKITERYNKPATRIVENRGFIEKTLAESPMRERRKDKFYDENFTPQKSAQKIYINYRFSESSYAALLLANELSTIGVKENRDEFRNKLRKHLVKLGIGKQSSIKIEEIS